MPMHDPAENSRPDAEATHPGADATPAGAAPDLTQAEHGVAAWFGRLERVEAPEGLRTRVLAAATVPAGRLLRFPMGRWGVASAALLLLALGAAITIEMTDPVMPVRSDPHVAKRAAADLKIAEDDTLALYHGVETFDEVGLAPGELIADWGR